MFRILIITLLFGCCASTPSLLLAADYAVSPLLIEHETEPRDIIADTITITNYSGRQVRIFPTVNAVTLSEGGVIEEFVTPSASDRSVTVTSWIEITRSRVEVPAGESVEVPVTFRISPSAEPGEYHAVIGLGSGSKRDEVEARAMQGLVPGVVVRLSIPEKRNEYIQLKNFSIDRVVTNSNQATVTYILENSGDIAQTPAGKLLFYNARGEEVGAIAINDAAQSVAPGESVTFIESLPDTAEWGRHKAFLEVAYGVNQRATVYDTTFFHIVPLRQLIIAFVVVLIVSVLIALYYHRRSVGDDDEDDDYLPVRVRVGTTATDQDHDINLRQ